MSGRILLLSRYGRLGASSRLRTIQYLPGLMLNGFEIEVAPLFADRYIERLYTGAVPFMEVLRSYARRLAGFLKKREYDLVWVEKEIWPWLPWVLDKILSPRSQPVVVDYDDAVFHRYDMHPSPVIRALLGRKLDRFMARADAVVAGNEYLQDRAIQAGCRRVDVIPTVVDLDRYPAPVIRSSGPQVRIGWIGSPNTAKYLSVVAPVIGRLAQEYDIDCVAVGARDDQVAGMPIRAARWQEEFEVDILSGFDVGIMPLEDTPWEQGKCGYKLIQYMACGMPVMASPVGVNNDLVIQGRNGFLAATEAHWFSGLRELIENEPLRHRMAAEGRALVERKYNAQHQLPRLISVFERALSGN